MKKWLFLALVFALSLSLVACSEDTAPASGPKISTGLVIEYDQNILLNIYDIRVSVDDSALGTQKQGEKKLYELNLPEGGHTLTLSEFGNDANITTETLEMSEGNYYYFFIKTRDSGITIEKRDTMTLDEAQALTGLEEDESTEVSEDSQSEVTSESDDEAMEKDENIENAENALREENITVKNNTDLATLFANGGDYDLCQAFFDQYKGKTIEFDGCVAYMALHGDYTTRYDLLIYAGDYSEDSANGSPAMTFNDVNITSDLHLTGNVPDSIEQGDNLHIIAKIEDIGNSYLFFLEPMSVSVR